MDIMPPSHPHTMEHTPTCRVKPPYGTSHKRFTLDHLPSARLARLARLSILTHCNFPVKEMFAVMSVFVRWQALICTRRQQNGYIAKRAICGCIPSSQIQVNKSTLFQLAMYIYSCRKVETYVPVRRWNYSHGTRPVKDVTNCVFQLQRTQTRVFVAHCQRQKWLGFVRCCKCSANRLCQISFHVYKCQKVVLEQWTKLLSTADLIF